MNKTFTINLGDTVHLSDPCYSTEDSNSGGGVYFNTPCVSGEWKITLEKNDRGYHTGFRGKSCDSSIDHTVDGFAFVDSGQFGIFDSAIWEDKKEFDDPNNFYGKSCTLTLSEEGCGVIDGSGFVSRTAYGDGRYDLTMYFNKDNKLTQFEIVFVSDELEDYEEDWEEDYDWDEDPVYI